jgi:5'-methylthioadenosine phosphorylase
MGMKIGVIGGSGLGMALASQEGVRHELDTPFGRPSDAIIQIERAGVEVYLLPRHGAGHLLNPSQVPYRANLHALKQLGVSHILASGAVGSLREEYKPRELVIPDQVIDKTCRRRGTFFDNAAVHIEFAEPFCPVLRRTIVEAAQGQDATTVHDGGCYVCMEGPAFSTRAESLMHRLWGGDLIGMTLMPEARLAREAEISYAAVALVTDYDCWRQKPAASVEQTGNTPEPRLQADPHVLLKEIISNLETATQSAYRLIERTIDRMATRSEELLAAPALRSLELAIWSDRKRIGPLEVQRLATLWGRYFPSSDAPEGDAEHTE